MDLMLRDGDLLPGADGQPLTVTGLAELRQRVMIRLQWKQSGSTARTHLELADPTYADLYG